MEVSYDEAVKLGWKYLICLPRGDGEHLLQWYKLPDNVFEHKKYPVCKCGRKFVPINGNKKECFRCQFLNK